MGFNFAEEEINEMYSLYSACLNEIHEETKGVADALSNFARELKYQPVIKLSDKAVEYYNEALKQDEIKAMEEWENSDLSFTKVMKEMSAGDSAENRSKQLEAQIEELLLQLHDLIIELGGGHAVKLVLLHYASPPSLVFAVSRAMILVFSGSLGWARRRASRASASATPLISKSTRPGFTTATQYSGEPLPEPIRVSAGFSVIGLSGKILLQPWPPRLV